MQGMFSEEHQWGDISKSSPIARKKGYRNTQNNSSSACQNIGTQKKCLISSGPFCNITSASSRDSRSWRLPGGMDYFINEPPWLQCPRPPLMVWGAQPSLEQSWGAQHNTQLCMAASKRQLITTQCKATTAEIPATFRCMQQLFPRLFVDGSVCCSPTFSCFWTPPDICQWDRCWVFEARGILWATRIVPESKAMSCCFLLSWNR